MKSISRAAATLGAAALAASLAACAPESAETAQTAEAPATAAPAGLAVSNARVVLPPVAGNPAAVYFDLSYTGADSVTLDQVAVEGAGMTMIHDYAQKGGKMEMTMAGPVTLAQGAPVSFAPGGLHVMAMEPSAALAAGGTARITLTLSNGTSISLDAPVRAAGDAR